MKLPTYYLKNVIFNVNLLGKGGSSEEVEAILRKLYAACERSHMLGRRQSSASVRGQLLRTLFLLVERPEQRVLLQLARLLLAVS